MSYFQSAYRDAIAQGRYSNITPWTKIGYNGDIDNAEEDIWPYGGTYVFPAAATKMDLVSTSTDDDGSPVGTGARTVTVYGVSATYAAQSETLTLDGTTPVTTSNSYLRINSMRVVTAGTGGVPIGNLSLSETGGTTYHYGYIRLGFTRQRQMVYTVPLGQTLYVTSTTVCGANASASHWCRFTMRANYDDASGTVLATTLFQPFFEVMVVDQAVERDFLVPLKFPATTTLRMVAVSDGASANEIVSCALRGYLTTP